MPPTRVSFGHRKRVRRRSILAWSAVSFLPPICARAQQSTTRIIGFLAGAIPPADAPKTSFTAALERGLNETGYVDGENLRIEYRASAEDLVKDNVELIIVASGGSVRQARNATATIPIVFMLVDDPVSAGVVASLNRPGGNVTGVSLLSSELMPKRLPLLRELVPEAMSCAVLINPRYPGAERDTRARLQEAADGMGLTLDIVSARSEGEFRAAFEKIKALKAGALLVTTDPLFTGQRDRLVELAAHYGLPASYPWREFVLAGGLISYGPSLIGRSGVMPARSWTAKNRPICP
jgi:putative tryptophan/tyrosine transport system substrate-binding protein